MIYFQKTERAMEVIGSHIKKCLTSWINKKKFSLLS